MGIVTLTSDWGTADGSVAVMKGKLLSRLTQLTIVDLCHEIPLHDQVKAAYIIGNTWSHFPAGTVHLICFGIPVNGRLQMIAVEKDDHFFIGFNDGLLALIFDAMPFPVFKINYEGNYNAMLNKMADVAVQLVNQTPITKTGDELPVAEKKNLFKPIVEQHQIKGRVIYIDKYENAITNITRDFFSNAIKENNFEIILRSRGNYRIERISEDYSEVDNYEVLARFNSSGYLEIALNRATASSMLGLYEGDIVRIEFK
ncbi:MAG: SAM-dependent chlorinase/fluorinase [Bacteroidia bacterium]|nr:SAM-dependent chlorinase/fluorinase [Bacteroidia bacterium]MCZ2276616.1 SAM-dependent chlorinase/fluorinase [Bacteroidia bacterium]